MKIHYWIIQVFTNLTSHSLKCVVGIHHSTKGLSLQTFSDQLQSEGTGRARERRGGASRPGSAGKHIAAQCRAWGPEVQAAHRFEPQKDKLLLKRH